MTGTLEPSLSRYREVRGLDVESGRTYPPRRYKDVEVQIRGGPDTSGWTALPLPADPCKGVNSRRDNETKKRQSRELKVTEGFLHEGVTVSPLVSSCFPTPSLQKGKPHPRSGPHSTKGSGGQRAGPMSELTPGCHSTSERDLSTKDPDSR